MARVAPIEGAKAPLLLHLLNWAGRHKLGQEPIPFKIMAHNPSFLLLFACMSRFSQGKTQLDPTIRELAVYLVAELNGCSWCIDYGRAQGERRGTVEKLAAIRDYRTDPRFTPAERAALA